MAVPAGVQPVASAGSRAACSGALQVLASPAPGAWCWAAPLWFNPLLPEVGPAAGPLALGLLPGLSSVGGLVEWWARMQVWRDRSAAVAAGGEPVRQDDWERWWWQHCPQAMQDAVLRAMVSDRGEFQERLRQVRDAVPQAWLVAAEAAVALPGEQQLPLLSSALRVMADCLGWSCAHAGRGVRQAVRLLGLSVRDGTALQLGPVVEQRAVAHAQFVAVAGGAGAAGAAAPPGACAALLASMRGAWCLPWENTHKEVWWRMTVMGVPHVGGHGLPAPHACPCGGLPEGSAPAATMRHVFWECPVASAVVEAVHVACASCPSQVGGSAAAPCPPLECRAVWLMQAPGWSRVHRGVWQLVCLAALEAMDLGRRKLVAMHCASLPVHDAQGLRQVTLHEAWGLPAPRGAAVPPVQRAGRWAVAKFWSLLSDFASLRRLPAGWGTVPLGDHPFLVRCAGGDGQDDFVEVRVSL